MMTKDERQTKACEAIRLRLLSIISLANDALLCISTDESLGLLDSIKTDAQFAIDTTSAIQMDQI